MTLINLKPWLEATLADGTTTVNLYAVDYTNDVAYFSYATAASGAFSTTTLSSDVLVTDTRVL